ncbi:hypothetical protein ACFPOI_16290 [Nonomuraea angiospora]|uniref:Uncharacterized protein n=1 Tax=Nonomuraea angiospora TaxID=46172 RepID=A0ABR9MH13_9ACTN|nr:hypothetical protein [Nonomuraea angiospora]MBE1592192.1 hypothetical protein [Nonomuraea angiospora]
MKRLPHTSYLLPTRARLFPHRIRAMYLDGVINQVLGFPDQQLRMFTKSTTWCAATPACALRGQDAAAVWRKLTQDADRNPIPVTSSQFGKGKLTGWHLRAFGFMGDPGPGNSGWPASAEAVAKASRPLPSRGLPCPAE